MTSPVFPPLFSGQDSAGQDPFAQACAAATAGCDAGLVVYDLGSDELRAAIVLAPEVPLAAAAIMLPVCGVGFQNALGAIGPPEVSVHLGWHGAIYVNGGRCGGLLMAASHTDPAAEPDWLVIGLTLQLWPKSDDMGLTPDETALYAEGCAEVDAVTLLEAWVRHTLVGINTWSDDGTQTLLREWNGLAHGKGKAITVGNQTGTFLGVDENLCLLLKTDTETVLIPLTDLLKRPS